ncbi:MAG: sodium:solute symporter family protein [Pseudomonadales bacterium]|uniref:Sodium:pantothenate symporter n=1 Tax=marine metagenome TaxID=408172 RepID=A0A381RZA5_9ZZZZ|nr:sodium:pantothenate symporter [Gammaproteobacteria bacterium]MCS5568925.1 sodium:solute symporter family protein [Pseudomonadales bacterium]MEC9239766.1 sodium:solute symporter family protein [Pseudomonadota bacterium]MEE3132625.1 sodium:solute symporter family protein [Pseudomonadota bacterium]
MDLATWSWIFMVVYISGMLAIGVIGQRRVKHADDFATARGSYGPIFLAFAFAATTASGATFLGGPGLGYQWGFASQWGNFLYPIGVYFGVLISMRLIATTGNKFGNRSIPEFLGDRYQSEGIRIMVSIFSLVLFFYLAGQLVSGLVMFEIFLGLSPFWALLITTTVLLFYVVLGGAHADILTDGVQGVMMLILAIVVIVLALTGFGVDGGLSGLIDRLETQNSNLVQPLNPESALTHSWWSIIAVLFAHIPLGLLPHLGNKLWALKGVGDQRTFIKLAFLFGLTLGMMGLGGLLARALLGDALLLEGANPNQALPLVFIELFPTWLAALIGVGILAAIMSTADGLVVSSSQIVANDLYRRSIAPRLRKTPSEDQLDQQVLTISRVTTVVVLVIAMGLAWTLMETNIALIVWIGTGGMMAAFAGPLVVGALWRGVTRAGAYTGLASGFVTFLILHTQLLDPSWFGSGWLHGAVVWLHGEGPNPFSCAAMGEAVSVSLTFLVSRSTQPLPQSHLEDMFTEAA